MGIMDNIKTILAAGAATAMSDKDIVLAEYQEFDGGLNRKWMMVGENYYKSSNDIAEGRETSFSGKNDIGGADNKLSHAQMKLLVDEKVNYLLAKDFSLQSDNKAFLEAVKATLGKRFGYTLTRLGYESSNKGIGWLQPYVDPKGALKTAVIPSEQCIPIWTSATHEELSAMIRYYGVTVFEGRQRKTITKMEYWTPAGLEFFELRDGKLVRDNDAYASHNVQIGDIVPHYAINGEPRFWGKVPFVAFKNNAFEYPDIRFIKGLIDNYDVSRSEIANFVEDVRNLIFILKGYGGENMTEFMTDLRRYRAIKIDNTQDAGVDTLNPKTDITAVQAHYEQLAKDIEKFGQGVPKDLEKLGNSPSGTALRFHFSGLDLKCNSMEAEYKFGFENLLYFVKLYLSEAGKGSYADADCDIVLNRDMPSNTDSVIKACVASKGLLSQETILSQHPWVSDIAAEMKRLAAEKPAETI